MFTTGRPALNKLSSGYTARKINFFKSVANIDYVNVDSQNPWLKIIMILEIEIRSNFWESSILHPPLSPPGKRDQINLPQTLWPPPPKKKK